MVGQLGEFNLSHLSRKSGKGGKIPVSINEKTKGADIYDKVCDIGSDGTATVTGALNGDTDAPRLTF